MYILRSAFKAEGWMFVESCTPLVALSDSIAAWSLLSNLIFQVSAFRDNLDTTKHGFTIIRIISNRPRRAPFVQAALVQRFRTACHPQRVAHPSSISPTDASTPSPPHPLAFIFLKPQTGCDCPACPAIAFYCKVLQDGRRTLSCSLSCRSCKLY